MKYVVFILLLLISACVKEETQIPTATVTQTESPRPTFDASKAELPWVGSSWISNHTGKFCAEGMLFYTLGGDNIKLMQPLDVEGKPMKCPV